MAIISEIRISLTAFSGCQAELIRCLLINAGVPGEQIIEQRYKGSCVISVYDRSTSRCRALAARLRSLRLQGVVIRLRAVRQQDWASRWKKYFKPFNITPDIRIVPLWAKEKKISGSSKALYLDTAFAFGSGLHATTRMMAKFLYDYKNSLVSFLDIGTGSGILALIAGAYGSRCVHAIDIDPVAINTAEANCVANGCKFAYIKAVSLKNEGQEKI